ncbi:HU family DNA-binding protein [uncultured Fusobacterium sp.]|uniref:HU family DNA-binding protein n=1 Tax=uncultured Fusobacterium sp. TaxID=159267 RepID=UPI0025E11C76|nr:HU family DNA-binding protein [uncultured Fusobacterium sp.]
MTKKEFVELYATKGDLSKKEAEKYINLFLDSVEEALIDGKEVSFVGWGKWEVVDRAPREVRNPQTQEIMKIEGKKVVKFKTGKLLADKIK